MGGERWAMGGGRGALMMLMRDARCAMRDGVHALRTWPQLKVTKGAWWVA
jgi:hypothetical protein